MLLCDYARKLWCIAVCNTCDLEIRHKTGKELLLAEALRRSHSDPKADEYAKTLREQKGLKQLVIHIDLSVLIDECL